MTLPIGCAPDLPLQRLQAFLGGLHTTAGVRSVEVLHLDGAEALRAVGAGALAFALVHDAGARDGIATRSLFCGEPLAAFLTLAHPLATSPALTPGHARGERLLMAPRGADPALHDRLVELLDEAGFRFGSARETLGASLRDLLFAVAQGDGVVVAPVSLHWRVGEVGEIVACVPLEPAVRMPDVVVAWRSAVPPRQLGAVLAVAQQLRSAPAFA